jgi:hydrogenase nickel incorporation protein HypA/HybF
VHEVAVAQRMVGIALRAADENGGGRVAAARLLLGTLTCVDPETLDFAFGVATRGTLAEGCRLEIVRISARLRCRSCRSEHERELLEPCPVCGTLGGEVLAGRELRLDTIDVEEPKTAASCVSQSAASGGSL